MLHPLSTVGCLNVNLHGQSEWFRYEGRLIHKLAMPGQVRSALAGASLCPAPYAAHNLTQSVTVLGS